MSNQTEAKPYRVICDECKGNGYIRIPYHLTKEETWANCEKCKSQGEIIKDPVPTLREKGLV
jgi:DnaJ-class molecular chaperone